MSEARQPLRDRHRARTRARIVSAGLELFLARGFDATTVADIAEAAEVSPATVFRYFGTKESLLFANHQVEQQELCDAVRRHIHLSDPRAVMAAAVLEFATSIRTEDENYADRIRIIRTSPALLGAALRTRAAWQLAAAEQLAAGPPNQPTLEQAVAASAGLGALHVAVQYWFAGKGEVALVHCVRDALVALWPDVPADA